jgi:Tfp pilus assembly protein PilV
MSKPFLYHCPGQTQRSQLGMSVLEALIAFSVLAVSALAVMRIQTDLRYSAALSQQRLQASRLAQQQVENWRAIPVVSTAKALPMTRDVYSDAATHYQIKRQVTQLTAPALLEISVWIQWKDQRQQTQQWQVHSLQSNLDTVYSGALALR